MHQPDFHEILSNRVIKKTNLSQIISVLIVIAVFLLIGCSRENEQPSIKPIPDQTVAIDASRTIEILIADKDRNNMLTVTARSENPNIASVSINQIENTAFAKADLKIRGRKEGETFVTIVATDDSGQNNASVEHVFEVTVVEPEILVTVPEPLKASNLEFSVVTVTLVGLSINLNSENIPDEHVQYETTVPDTVEVSGIEGVTAISHSINDTTIQLDLYYDYSGFPTGTDLTFTVNPDALAEEYTGTPLTVKVPVIADLREEAYYRHIQGPWLWMIAPGGSIDNDNLADASDGVITEYDIAEYGVTEGEHFDNLEWTSGRLLNTTVCGLFLCSSDNVINVVREIGLTSYTQLTQYSAYALIYISSPTAQKDVLMGVGSDDSIKVWLNGVNIYTKDVRRRTTGIQNRFLVDLKQGDNVLLVKVCNQGSGGNDDWGMFYKIYLDPADYTTYIPMRK